MHSLSTAEQGQPVEANKDAASTSPGKRTKDVKTVGRLMTLKQAAEYCGLSYWLLRDYCLDGILPIVRLPGSRLKGNKGIKSHSTEHTMRKIMIDREDIDQLIQECKGR
jgi:hypothetical protein